MLEMANETTFVAKTIKANLTADQSPLTTSDYDLRPGDSIEDHVTMKTPESPWSWPNKDDLLPQTDTNGYQHYRHRTSPLHP
jgi:hypothetical protein